MAWEGAIENGLLHPPGLLFSLSKVVEGVDSTMEANSEKLLVKAALSGSGTHLLNLNRQTRVWEHAALTSALGLQPACEAELFLGYSCYSPL